jgi:hypothetical protein
MTRAANLFLEQYQWMFYPFCLVTLILAPFSNINQTTTSLCAWELAKAMKWSHSVIVILNINVGAVIHNDHSWCC